MSSFEEVFARVMEHCLGVVGQTALKLWISPLVPLTLTGEEAIFEVPSDFQRTVIRNNYEKILKDAFLETSGLDIEIVLKVKDEDVIAPPVDLKEIDQKHDELEKTFETAEYEFTFDTFIVGRSNEFAYAACTAITKGTQFSTPYNPLFIYGKSGLGKTHLITAIANEIKRSAPNLKVILVSGESFSNELIEAIQAKRGTGAFHEKYRSADVLLVDDIQFIAGKESTQEEFFHTFNKLFNEGKQIVLTSDQPPKDIKTLAERIRSRFESGLIADISLPDFETRFAIVRRKAELLDLNMQEEVCEFLANRLKSNIRQLEGAVKKLKALKHLAGSAPTISMAQSVIREILSDDHPIPITVGKIIAEVGNIYGVSADDIRSNKRSYQVSNARKVAMYLIRTITGLSLQNVGIEFNGRDHSTVVYAVNNVAATMENDPNFNEMILDIIKSIQEKG